MKGNESELSLNSRVFYPSHGAGTIVGQRKIVFGGMEKDYYDFEFINQTLTISTPVENLDKLGIRPVATPKIIKEKLKVLKSIPVEKPETADYSVLIDDIRQLEDTAQIDSFIRIIQYCNHEAKIREKEGRLVPVSINKIIHSAMDNLIGELALSENIDYVSAKEAFGKLTGLQAK